MSSLRSDAARSRQQILRAARGRAIDDLRFNELAREAGVGVGTVYRHFPNMPALVEALNHDALELLVERARAALDATDPAAALDAFVREAVQLQVERDGLQSVLLSPDASPDARALRDELMPLVQRILDRAAEAGALRTGISVDQLQRLVCGVEHAVRLGGGRDRDLFLGVVLAGLRP
ncbi:TetR/AcrR family transcriptional regulator [Microbacterium sediminis]|uniref:TetR family transcriptional regulator n=1 Tax=Microbacterium sediminis TaxID=904291 RepID=A0A1B9NAG8_9MICO|nr:TetR/AcrR family transcriptional regulator [Microbacterium sediminis]OCG73612.1 TetR family transcriptional regulator [Microbacterium sediminis]QBR73291.1 TetR family transcriptional regulator [Microbacterium sediminis]